MSESPDAKRDRELGMDRKITRRDFLDGAALTVGGAILAGSVAGGSGGRPGRLRGDGHAGDGGAGRRIRRR